MNKPIRFSLARSSEILIDIAPFGIWTTKWYPFVRDGWTKEPSNHSQSLSSTPQIPQELITKPESIIPSQPTDCKKYETLPFSKNWENCK